MPHNESFDFAEYYDMCDNASDLIQSVTPDGHFRYVNKAWHSTLGYSEQELVSMTIFDIIHPEEIDHCREIFMQVLSGVPVDLVTTRFLTRDGGTVFVEGNVNCQITDGKPGYTRAVFRDMTRLIESEQKVQRLYEQEKRLRESLEGEIERRTEFSRILVHELRTPMTSLLGAVELFAESEQKPPYDRAVGSLQRSADELNSRIGELLELTRAEVGTLRMKPRLINPGRLIHELVKESIPAAAGKSIRLEENIPANLTSVKADRRRIRQVLQNIIDNAMNVTPKGGSITVAALEDHENLMIRITDTGPGISRKEQLRIFEPYFRGTGNEGYAGLGLGLTLSKRIIEQHGGRIWLESETGKGSVFFIALPKAGRS